MKRCGGVHGQKGYALVVVGLLVMLSSIIGLALLTNTLVSHKSVLASENNTKAKYLAEYGATYGLDALEQHLDQLNSGHISDWDWMLAKVEELRNFQGTGYPDASQSGEMFEYRLVLNEQPDVNNRHMGVYVISGYLYATGTANGEEIKFRVPVQISNVADVFNFALAAKNNIWLNGGVEIHGSLYAGNALALHKIAHFKHGSQYNFESVYPEINGKISAGPIDKPEHRIYHVPNHNNDKNLVGDHSLANLSPVRLDRLDQYLYGNYKVAKTSSITFPELDMSQIQQEISAAAGFSLNNVKSSGTHVAKRNHGGVDYYYVTGADRTCFILCGPYYETKTTYRIGASHGNKGPFEGVYFINGNLDIRGDVNLQGTFYVNGNVSIQYTKRTENPIAAAIIATGDIEIANNNLHEDVPATLNAFFWSLKNDFIIYGVGSNLKIHGGVIANNIVLNGVRGRSWVDSGYLDFSPKPQTYMRNGNKVPSRLTIVYDEQFITHPPAGVPTNEGFRMTQVGQWEYVE